MITKATLPDSARIELPKLNRYSSRTEVREARAEAMLQALRKLCAMPRHGQPMSTYAIARATGYDRESIRLIERSALRKMRNRLPPEIRGQLDSYLAKDRTTATPRKTQNA